VSRHEKYLVRDKVPGPSFFILIVFARRRRGGGPPVVLTTATLLMRATETSFELISFREEMAVHVSLCNGFFSSILVAISVRWVLSFREWGFEGWEWVE
jgi:hypothetical protein